MHAWRFCDGWQPERLPVYLAIQPVDEVDKVIELMQTIRDALNAEEDE